MERRDLSWRTPGYNRDIYREQRKTSEFFSLFTLLIFDVTVIGIFRLFCSLCWSV